jgi:hypothetical protein
MRRRALVTDGLQRGREMACNIRVLDRYNFNIFYSVRVFITAAAVGRATKQDISPIARDDGLKRVLAIHVVVKQRSILADELLRAEQQCEQHGATQPRSR